MFMTNIPADQQDFPAPTYLYVQGRISCRKTELTPILAISLTAWSWIPPQKMRLRAYIPASSPEEKPNGCGIS
jgi:hypothetical protein